MQVKKAVAPAARSKPRQLIGDLRFQICRVCPNGFENWLTNGRTRNRREKEKEEEEEFSVQGESLG